MPIEIRWCYRQGLPSHIRRYYSCPLGWWVLKYRPFLFLFLPSPSRICKLIGFSGSRDVFFLSRANSTARCRRCFVAELFQVCIVFLVVAIFAKTECYSPSNLQVRSAMCLTSAMYQLSTCRKWYVHHFKHFSHETCKHHASTVTCSESKWKKPPGQNDHSRQKQTNSFSYQSSYWGMSTLAVPVLFDYTIELILLLERQGPRMRSGDEWREF